MATQHFRYSYWDGTQEIPDFTADDLLESMADDLLLGGDPERALRNLLRRGFQLPDGRRFDGLQRLLRQMREYRQDAFSRYDPNGMVDQIREQLESIVQTEREEIDRRRAGQEKSPNQMAGGQAMPHGESGQQRDGQSDDSGMDGSPQRQCGQRPAPGQGQAGQGTSGQSGQPGETGQSGSAGSSDEFQRMLQRMLQRKENYLDNLPPDNAGRIRDLREYDFLSPEAREAFESLIGGMQRELMQQYFQGMKQGIGNMTRQDMGAIRLMAQDLNQMLEDAQKGDREAFTG